MESIIRWIADNPPDKTRRYLVTYSTGIVDTCLWCNATCYYGDDRTVYNWLSPRGTVIAYAELPEPYKEEDQ